MSNQRLGVAAVFAIVFGAMGGGAAEARQVINYCPAAPANVTVERVPFRTAVKFNITSNEDVHGKPLLTVPVGKNLTLQHVNAIFFGEGQPTYFLRFSSNFEDIAAFTVTTGLWQGNMAGRYRTLNQPITLDLASGESVFAQVMRSQKGMFTSVTINVDGYLTDVPCVPIVRQ